MATPRRSGRVAAQDIKPDYTEPNESGRERKRKSDATGNSPSAKRGRKTKSKENLKEQKTLEETMDVDKEDLKPESVQFSSEAAADVSEAKKADPELPMDSDKTQQTIDQAMPDAPAKEQEVKPTESQPESKAPEQPSSSSDKKPVETSAPAAQEKPSAPFEHDGPASIDTSTAKAEEKSSEAPKDDAKASEASKPEKPAEEPNQAEPKPTQPSVSNGKPSELSAQNGVKEQTSDGAPQAHQTAAHSSEGKKPDAAPAANGTVDSHARDDNVPSSILEKGIIYFFFRPRVNVTDPSDVTDIARSYLILRPLPHGAALADGPIPDAHNSRLLALPKKVLPTSGKDKFMVFVEKAQVSFTELKSDFMSASDYATKTQGTSHSPPVTPLAEGVYAITTTGRESHLAYMTTVPSSLGEVQRDIGLKESGSFVVSAKNPKYPGPANADLGKDPGFSEKIMSDFRDLRWMPLKPDLLDYANAQVLLIGEDAEKALEGLPRDEREGKDGVKEEMESLEGEDEVRVRHLKGDDAVFKDLGISKSDYPQVPTTW